MQDESMTAETARLPKQSTEKSTQDKVKEIAFSGLFIAMVFVTTMFINIRLPISINGGLVHAGNVMLFTISILFGKKQGAIAGAFGMGLFDILSGWAAWAPFTFIIRGVMGFLIGSISNLNGRKGTSPLWNLIAILIGSVWMITGYYVAEGILYGNWIAPASSIPGNIIQLVIGLAALVLVPILKKAKMEVIS